MSAAERGGGSVHAITRPLVSILIPVHDGLGFTQPCLESIWANEIRDIPCEILVIDDQSTDGTTEYLNSLGKRIRVIQNETRKSFAEKMNQAASAAEGEYLCLLNNDTIVTPGWLKELLGVARDDPTIAVVGNRQLVPATGRIDHAGVVIRPNGRPTHLYRGEEAHFWPSLLSQEMQILTGACWLVSRQHFLDLGGLDTNFRFGYEDVDFCLRARQMGYRNFYNAESVIYHHVSSTPGRKDHEDANVAYYLKKWEGLLVSDLHEFYFPPPPQPPANPVEIKVLEPALPLEVSSPEPPRDRPSHIEERYAHIERLHERHPLIASLLRSLVRFATSTAKTLNRWKI